MTRVLRFVFIICFIKIMSPVEAQQLETRLSISGSSGVVSNTFLTPVLAEWDRSATAAYYSFMPTGSVSWSVPGRSIQVMAGGHIFDQLDERSTWFGGLSSATVSQRLTQNWTAEATGGFNYFQSDYTRNMQWAHVKVNRLLSTFTKASVQAGVSWRGYEFEEESRSNRYDTYGLVLEHWLGFNWNVSGRFLSSFAHITDPTQGFSSAVTVGYRPVSDLSLSLRLSMDQYTDEFRLDGEGGAAPPDENQTDETFVIEDQIFRGTIDGRYNLSRNISLTGRVSGLGWSSSTDEQFLTDYEVTAGVEVSITPDFSAGDDLREVSWKNLSSGEPSVIETRYRGDGRLYIIGEFNDWEEPGIPLREVSRNRYRAEIDMTAGSHEYKIRVRRNDEEEWLDLPESTPTVDDGFGGRNGRIIVDF